MKIFYVLLICLSLMCTGQSEIQSPHIIFDENIACEKLEKTNDINLFYLSKVQYLERIQSPIKLNYIDHDRQNPLLNNNYKRPSDTLHKQYKDDYKNLKILVDITQTTPLTKIFEDLTKITMEEVNIQVDRMNEGKQPTREIPTVTTYYDGFPVTVYNAEDKDIIIGFGNHIPLELEALDRDNSWKTIYGARKYVCGVGIQYIMLKPKQMAVVFEPRLSGNFKTKFRYRLKNIVSNEFEGNINDSYFKN